MKFTAFWKERVAPHYLAILIALIAGVATISPQIVAMKSTPEFKGVLKTVNNDEVYYLARVKEVMDGHSLISNPFLYEYKDALPMQVWLPDYFLGKPLALLGIPVQIGFLGYDFLLPTILALLTYAVLFLLMRSKTVAIAGVIFLNLHVFFLLYNRSPSPQFNFIFFLLLFLNVILYHRDLKNRTLVFVAVAYGLLFYIYPYYWTFYTVLLALYIFVNWMLGRRTLALHMAGAFAGGVVIGLPYLIVTIRAGTLSTYGDTMMRLGLISTHFPSGMTIVVGTICVLGAAGIVWLKDRKVFSNQNSIFLLCGVAASGIVANQHIITGKNLEFSSHYLPLSIFWFMVTAIFITLMFVQSKMKEREHSLSIIALLIAIFFGVGTMSAAFKSQSVYTKAEIDEQSYKVVFDWLNAHGQKDAVVYTDPILSTLIPVYTSLNVYSALGANFFYVTTLELNRRFFINNYFETMDRDFVIKNERSIFGTYYVNRFAHNQSKNRLRALFDIPQAKYERLPEAEIDRVVKMANEISHTDFQKLLGEFRVDYILWDKETEPGWKLDRFVFLKPEFKTERFVLYKVLL